MIRVHIRVALTVGVVALCAAAPARAATWSPDVAAARAYAETRPGTVSFSLLVGDRSYGLRPARVVAAASLMKTMLLAAYLRRSDVRGRDLRREEDALLEPMIRFSGNVAATRVRDRVGVVGQLAVARAAGMRDFVPITVWGLSRTSARDQARLFWRLGDLLPPRHRAYALNLLATITPPQRWGAGEVQLPGWELYFKGGWGSGTGRVDHQAALLTKDGRRVALAITTTDNGSHAVGKATLRGVAARLLHGL